MCVDFKSIQLKQVSKYGQAYRRKKLLAVAFSLNNLLFAHSVQQKWISINYHKFRKDLALQASLNPQELLDRIFQWALHSQLWIN
jgi:hypothetical protein